MNQNLSGTFLLAFNDSPVDAPAFGLVSAIAHLAESLQKFGRTSSRRAARTQTTGRLAHA